MLTASWCSPPCSAIRLNYHCVFKRPHWDANANSFLMLICLLVAVPCVFQYSNIFQWHTSREFCSSLRLQKLFTLTNCVDIAFLKIYLKGKNFAQNYSRVSGKKCDSISGDGRRFHLLPFLHLSYSRGLISQTFSLPMLPFCFLSITYTITDGWGPLSKDKAGVISPLAFPDTWITFGSHTENTRVLKLLSQTVNWWINSSIKGSTFIFL